MVVVAATVVVAMVMVVAVAVVMAVLVVMAAVVVVVVVVTTTTVAEAPRSLMWRRPWRGGAGKAALTLQAESGDRRCGKHARHGARAWGGGGRNF